MRFRSGKFWFSIGFSALALAQSPSVHAMQITLGAQSNGAATGDGNYAPTFYFPAYNGAAVPPIAAPYTPVGFTYNDLSQTDSTQPQQVVLNITPAAAPSPSPSSGVTTGNVLVVTSISAETGGNTEGVPIIQTGQGALGSCPSGSNPGQCTGFYNNYFHALVLPGGTFQITLNVAAICNDYNTEAGVTFHAKGCDSNMVPPPGQGTQDTHGFASLILTVGVLQGYNLSAPTKIENPTLTDTQQITLVFANRGNSTAGSGAFSCNLSGSYQPGDEQITVDGSKFSLNATSTPDSAPNGLFGIYVVAKEGAPTPLSPTAATFSAGGFSPQQFINPFSGQTIGGFQNTTDVTSPINYAVGFMGLDFYGFPEDNSAGTCGYKFPVETSQINGFLNGSKCFIATAAFRSMDSAPLVLLRAFRDQVLEHFGGGRAFVHWYYNWSPGAADWLVEHPTFRFPVLLALIPLQMLAWLILHPAFLTSLFMMALSLFGFTIFGGRRKQEMNG